MKKYRIFLPFISIFIFICLVSCDKTKSSFLQKSTGSVGEVIVIIDDNKWLGNTGDTIFNILSQNHLGFPQAEPIFKVSQIPQNALNDFFKSHRNIIVSKISNQYTEPLLIIENDKWAKPQIIISFCAKDELSFKELFVKNSQLIIDTLLNSEILRFQNIFKLSENKEIEKILKNKYKISISIPDDYNLDVAKDNFIWISKETSATSQGILIYWYDYENENSFTDDYLISKRDSVLKINVPGPNSNSYMTTEKMLPVYLKEYYSNNQYIYELRGLWKTEGAFLGGPFISLSQIDKKIKKVITVEGYVYAGKLEKKIYFWQVEAIAKTLHLND